MTDNGDSGIVYSTEHGKMCPSCGRAKKDCVCVKRSQPSKGDGTVRVYMERKGRKGKGVTVVKNIPLDTHDLKLFAKQLKQRCGTGGTVKNSNIEIQGDFRDIILEILKTAGYKAKRAGS